MATVVSTAPSGEHTFSKQSHASITLVEGLSTAGDCHAGKNVRHRSRLHIVPPPANIRQVHLMQQEIFDRHSLKPSELGENILTRGIDLLALGRGAKLHFVSYEVPEEVMLGEEHAIVTITGLRNPCPQIEKHRKGLQELFMDTDTERRS